VVIRNNATAVKGPQARRTESSGDFACHRTVIKPV